VRARKRPTPRARVYAEKRECSFHVRIVVTQSRSGNCYAREAVRSRARGRSSGERRKKVSVREVSVRAEGSTEEESSQKGNPRAVLSDLRWPRNTHCAATSGLVHCGQIRRVVRLELNLRDRSCK